jgi:AraC-like DNA-binding protein
MIYKSFLPAPPLREFVRNYTIIHFQFKSGEPIPNKQRSPKAEQKIVFYIKDSPTLYGVDKTQTPAPVSIFNHQLDKKKIQMPAEFFAFIIFFQPGALHKLIRLPMMELVYEICDAEIFFGSAVRDVRDQLAQATSHQEMISIVEQFLNRECKKLLSSNSIDNIALHLMADPTSFSLDEIAKQACLSTKQFYRRFTERIGMSPKLFSRLSRFNRAYQYKIANPTFSWSSIAQEFCYTDYHHLEKEFKEFTSLTPQQWTDTHLSAPERILKLR